MGKRVMFATMKSTPGQREQLRAQFDEVFAAANAEAGTQVYSMIEGDDPDTLYMLEIYDDQAAMDSHMGGEALAALYPKIGPFLADGGAVTGTVVREID